MSLEKSRSNRAEERHLTLYDDIERQLTPHSNLSATDTISQQFYTASKKPKIGLIVFTSILTALLTTALLLQYLPVSQLDAYRPTSLWSQGKKELIKQANALSDVIDYTKCVEKGGVVVSEQPSFCVLQNKRYYQVVSQSSSSSAISSQPLPKPLNANLLNFYSMGRDTTILTTGDVIYTGYSSPNTQFISQMIIRNTSRISLADQTTITEYVNSTQPFASKLQELFATNTPAQSVSEVMELDIKSAITNLYPGFSGSGSLISTSASTGTGAYELRLMLSGPEYVILLSHMLPQSFSDATNKKFGEICTSKEKTEDQITCLRDSVLVDKSLTEKINKDSADLLKLFALAG